MLGRTHESHRRRRCPTGETSDLRDYDSDVIRRIVEHNELNGVAFSTFEFLLVAAAAALVGVGFGAHGQAIGMVLAAGTALNGLVIVGFGVSAWRRGERGTPLKQLFSARHRAELTSEHPGLMADTLIVAAAALVPFALLMSTAVEMGRGRPSRS
jgi:hypothetical protein